jgi:hypothetical protein
MGETMISRVWARIASAFATAVSVAAFSAPLMAAELPGVKLSDSNNVPACVTPGRLTEFLEERNPSVDSKFATIAADYARIGDQLGIRWDVAFFQMLLETGNLKFTGDVSVDQNNFAGLGATGRKNPGESFPDVSTGVTAHLQHLLLYAGEHFDNPVAERTRKVQEWGVLTDWQKTIKGPMTFSQLAHQWAPGSRHYARDISGIADAFMSGPCIRADPKPEMMALWKPELAPKKTEAANADDASGTYTPPKVTGYELARRANQEARSSGSYIRSSLGAGMLAAIEPTKPETAENSTPNTVKILNAAEADKTPPVAETKDTPAKIQTASLATGVKGLAAPAPKSKCKVWTASYGGTRAVIIKAKSDDQENFTVLDVNEATAGRETEAYIAAYAKGGEKLGGFMSPEQALDKAFQLCPEG